MAKVLLLSVEEETPADNSFARGVYTRLKQSAEMGKSRHVIVNDPEEADLILFAEFHVEVPCKLKGHPYGRKFRDKCFIFAVDDNVLPYFPGVFASIEKSWYLPRRVRSGFYLSILENPYIAFDPAPAERDLLYSFVGSVNTSPVRESLSKLEHPRSIFIDTSKDSLSTRVSGTDEQRNVFWKKYVDIASRCSFVLCPRGIGTSSIRLFEMMEMGRAPVIISDEWVPPSGPRWEDFSIRIPESEIPLLPRILESREHEALALGLKAREEWERWFAPDAVFNTVIDWCLEIKAARRLPEFLAQMSIYPQMLRPYFFRAYLRSWKRTLLQRNSQAN